MAKAPAFQFYTKDWLSDAKVKRLDYFTKGVYIELLAIMWTEGRDSLLDDDDAIASLLHLTRKKWAQVRAKLQQPFSIFLEVDGRLVSKRLREERRKQRKLRKIRQSAASARWQSKSNANAKQLVCLASASSSASAKKKKDPPISTQRVDDIQRAISILQNLPRGGNAKALQDTAASRLAEAGYAVETEHKVKDRGDGHPGAIDILVNAQPPIAIELDRRAPREKSLFKLRQINGHRIIVLREGPNQPPPDGITRVIGLQPLGDPPLEFGGAQRPFSQPEPEQLPPEVYGPLLDAYRGAAHNPTTVGILPQKWKEYFLELHKAGVDLSVITAETIKKAKAWGKRERWGWGVGTFRRWFEDEYKPGTKTSTGPSEGELALQAVKARDAAEAEATRKAFGELDKTERDKWIAEARQKAEDSPLLPSSPKDDMVLKMALRAYAMERKRQRYAQTPRKQGAPT